MIKALLSILMLLVTSLNLGATQPMHINKKKVLISQVVDHPALNMTVQGIIAGLKANGYDQEYNLELRIESAQANLAIAAQIANKFVNQHPDVVVGVGTIAAQSFIKYALNKQVKLVFSSVTDPNSAALYASNNISGVSNFVSLEPQLELFKALQPNLTKLGIIYNPGEINSLSIVEQLEKICEKFNLVLIKQAVTKTADVAQAAVKLAKNVEAIFISNDNTALSSLQSIIKSAQAHKIPVYVSDTDAVSLGAVAALGPNQYDIGYQTGIMIAKVLDGIELGKLPIEYPIKNELFINPSAAAKANIIVAQKLLTQAKVIAALSGEN